MRLSRKSRLLAALFALVSVLFMQLAIAAYTCPVVENNAAVASETGMPGCEEMDMMQPGLCHAHDQAGTQALDKSGSPPLQSFLPIASGQIVSRIATAHGAIAARPGGLLLTRSTAPPILILHCCFRI